MNRCMGPRLGETGPREVTDLIRHGGEHTMVKVELADGSIIDATDEHPFWVQSERAWIDAEDLLPGDTVVRASGRTVTVTGT